MALALYRKYRPATFAEVVGQEHVTDPLRIALRAKRVNHAYLFSGPRGCGKTSSARILARSLNCEQGPTDEPCGTCDSCVALAPNGPGNVDVVELDAASHGGVDDARELRDRAFFAPAQSRYRVFIVDEAHMVTTQGFNALLKIVEEPPEHLVFVFATTEPDKVLPTIRSRTHHYPFRLIPPGAMRELLERNIAAEGIAVEPAVYPLVIRAGGGSARDTQSVLDQLLAGAGPQGVTYERAVALLGVTDVVLIDDMIDALATDDAATVYGTVDRLVEAGHDPRRFASDLLDRLRDLVLLRAVPEAADRGLVAAPADELARMVDQAARLKPATLTRYAEIVHNGLIEMRGATAPRLLLELLCARMLLPAAVPTDQAADAAVLQRLERIERRVSAGGTAAEAAEPEPAARAFERPSQRPAESAPKPAPKPAAAPVEPPKSAEPPQPAKSAELPQTAAPAPEPPPALEPQPEPAAAPSEPEPAAAAGSIDVAGVRRAWPDVLSFVRKQPGGRSTEAMLTQAGVQSVDGNTAVITHNSPPLARRLAESRNTDMVASALGAVFGGRWQVQVIHDGGAAAPPSAPPPKPQPKPITRPSRPTGAPTSKPADDIPPPPEPPDDEPPPPDEDDEEAMLAEAAHGPTEAERSRPDPEEAVLKLLTDELGATKIDR